MVREPLSPRHNQRQFGALEIANGVQITRRFRYGRWLWYLSAICLPLVLILFFFSLRYDITIIPAIIPADSPAVLSITSPPGTLVPDLPKEFRYTLLEQIKFIKEIHAAVLSFYRSGSLEDWKRDNWTRETDLSFLRNRELYLLGLWEQTLPFTSPPNNSSSSATPVPDLLEEFRSELLELIKLNKYINVALLSYHRDSPGNLMQEDELRALFLLRNQKLRLLQLWNQIVPRSSGSLPSNNASSESLDDNVDF